MPESPIDFQTTTAGPGHGESSGREVARPPPALERGVDQSDKDGRRDREQRHLVGMEVGVGALVEDVHRAELERAHEGEPDSGRRRDAAGPQERREYSERDGEPRHGDGRRVEPCQSLQEAE